MASEDSDQALPGRFSVHRFSDFRDLDETIGIYVPTGFDNPHTTRELLEVHLLRRPERMGFEERDYRSQKLYPSVHNELAQMLTMIVVSFADIDPANAKEAV
jgi:hypothetical protein